MAVQAFRAAGAAGRIGIALNLLPIYPVFPNSERAVDRVDASENRLFLDPVLLGSYPENAVGALPMKQRAAVAYHYLAGLPYAEIAVILGGTAEAARRAAADGIASLRRSAARTTPTGQRPKERSAP